MTKLIHLFQEGQSVLDESMIKNTSQGFPTEYK